MSADAAEQLFAPELEAVATAADRQLRTWLARNLRTQIFSGGRSPTQPPPRSPQATQSPRWPTPNGADSSVPAPHRDIATSAQVAHGTIRAILTSANGETAPAPPEPEGTAPASHGTAMPLPS